MEESVSPLTWKLALNNLHAAIHVEHLLLHHLEVLLDRWLWRIFNPEKEIEIMDEQKQI